MSNIEKALKKNRDDIEVNDTKSSSESKLDKGDNHILSAIQKRDGKDRVVHSPLISADYDQIIEGGSQIQDSGSKKVEAESVMPVTTTSDFNVDERVVSYYETVGKQTWKGPVMIHFRRLQVSLGGLQKNNMCKVMLFTSSQQGEGKSTIALNVAITLSGDKKKKIAIVDCDFRKPTLNTLLGLSPNKGLSDYLLGNAGFNDICFNGLFPNLTLIPVGNRPSNICELLASDEMHQIVSNLKEQYDYVIIDTPPVLAFPDTVILAPMSDGVVFVISSKIAKRRIVKRAIETLKDCKIAGFVMNMSEVATIDYYGNSSDYYYYNYASS